MVYGLAHGNTALTVPIFDDYLNRMDGSIAIGGPKACPLIAAEWTEFNGHQHPDPTECARLSAGAQSLMLQPQARS
jgi:hypothetical protein